jgi:hypothetical protein
VVGIVEGYELLEARDNGWLVVFYSYSVAGTGHSGEFRKWLLFSRFSRDKQTGKVTDEYPRGAKVSIRFNPKEPSESVAGV